MRDLESWTRQCPMSDPAGHAAAVADLPSGIGDLNAIVQGVLVHSAWLDAYGLTDERFRTASRATLPVAERLDAVVAIDPMSLQVRRPPDRRSVGTCRDFALMLCGFLRAKGIPARVRCGFANYFASGWEDHWVCEYWERHRKSWRLSDAQIDFVQRENRRINFDTTDVPRDAFVTAGEAWLKCRASRADPNRFGQGDVTGAWFIKVNVVRDHYVLHGRVTSVWDGWRNAPASKRVVGERETALLDDLAARPEQPLVEIGPDWLG